MSKTTIFLCVEVLCSIFIITSCCLSSTVLYNTIQTRLLAMDEVSSVRLVNDDSLIAPDLDIEIGLKNGGVLVIHRIGMNGNMKIAQLVRINETTLSSYLYLYKRIQNIKTKAYTDLLIPHRSIYINHLEILLNLDLSTVYNVVKNYDAILEAIRLEIDQNYSLDDWSKTPKSGFIADDKGEYKLFVRTD